MTDGTDRASLSNAVLAARLLANDPGELGGIVVRARYGPVRDRWLAHFRALLPVETPVRPLPLHAGEDRVFGGLDLAATLAAGRPVHQAGLLRDGHGGIVVLSMAERLSAVMAARLGAVIDQAPTSGNGEHRPQGFVALDEGCDADEVVPAALRDRLAFCIDLDDFDPARSSADWMLTGARLSPSRVGVDEAVVTALVATAAALGVASLRPVVLALAAARGLAALDGRTEVDEADAALAARLVLAPRATQIPAAPPSDDEPADTAPPEAPPDHPSERSESDGVDREPGPPKRLDDVVLAAAASAIPPGLLLRLRGETTRAMRAVAGRTGALGASTRRGRPVGVRQSPPSSEARLNVVETLRAAAPWQRLRRAAGAASAGPARVEIRRDDLRVTRLKQRTETTTIFVVDASGSLAFARLAEAKGAVELLLADCYIRRDQVALLAFRGQGAELILPPTRSLARAKRTLAGLPGGGSTPLAAAIDAAAILALAARRRGQTPMVVFLTDARGNVARDGSTGRDRARADAQAAASTVAAASIRSLVIDVGARPSVDAEALATTLRGRYLALPRADATALSRAVLMAAEA